MNERVHRLRTESMATPITISAERAELITEFYSENIGKFSIPMMRAKALAHLYQNQSLHIGQDELIVGERGPRPRAVSTFPELTCHSEEDLRILDSRPLTGYGVSAETIRIYREKVIPFWHGRTMRAHLFAGLSDRWQGAYEAGVFTEFMEQRAPGHTTLDGKFYSKGLLVFKQKIADAAANLDFMTDPAATAKREQLNAMACACNAVIAFAGRHAELATEMAESCADPVRKNELRLIARTCRHVPAQAPREFREALQMYWFMHLATITELNGWDAMNPGHLDRSIYPFYRRDCERGLLDRAQAKELLECFWIKFNNHPAPPKVGVTAAESGTYNDFTNINLGGILPDGSDGVNELSYLMLEVMDEMHLLQPQGNIQLSRKNPDRFLKAACRVIRNGYGYPSLFNADGVVEQMVRCGKRIEDAREGGTSGCVETGAFGKEAYILTGYLNTPKILEITLNNGVDPRPGCKIGIETGAPLDWVSFDDLFAAFERQLNYFVDLKVAGNQFIEQQYATRMPAVFLSVLIDDCIKNGKDYNAGGARYNTSYIQCVGIGTITDSLSAILQHVYRDRTLALSDLLTSLERNFEDCEALRSRLAEETPRYGNDDDRADEIMRRVFEALVAAIEGRPNTRGGEYHVNMLPTTCHIHFGAVLGASADGRKAGIPVSEGISPVQGADRNGPTAVMKSAARMDQLRTGGTLLNMKFLPSVLGDEVGITKLSQLVRTYFRMDGHHVQFNVVDANELRAAQKHPEAHRNLIVRVAGYSDYFCDLSRELQDEIIRRTAHTGV
jgi:trans-4-hydroxy-L-proline dehydratase